MDQRQTVDLYGTIVPSLPAGVIPLDWSFSEDGHMYIIMSFPGPAPDIITHWQIIPPSTEDVSLEVKYVDIVSAWVWGGSIGFGRCDEQFLFAWSSGQLVALERDVGNGSLVLRVANLSASVPILSLEVIS